jgi:predicted RNA-binding Zn-ribbon protein involved in translation (DUF1610 family)
MDCGKQLSRNAYYYRHKRCNSCARKISSLKHGETLKKHYCVNCGKEVGYMSKRCVKCSNIYNAKIRITIHKPNCQCCACKAHRGEYDGEKNPMFGIKRNGELNPNFKNWKTSLGQLIKTLNEFKQWRNQVYKRDNYTCQECGDAKGGNLECHHKIPFAKLLDNFLQSYSQFSPLEDKETLIRLAITYKSFWDINNGQTLCKKCHYKLKKQTWSLIYD